jgi:hypothetical protein
MELGSRMGSVTGDRWTMDAANLVDALPTRRYHAPKDDAKDNGMSSPTKKQKSSLVLFNEDPTLCQICQCNYEEEEMLKVLPCKHEFHVGCVDRWLAQKDSCPLCKASINAEEVSDAKATTQLSQPAAE